MAKLNEYYERTAASDAHIIAMGVHIYFSSFRFRVLIITYQFLILPWSLNTSTSIGVQSYWRRWKWQSKPLYVFVLFFSFNVSDTFYSLLSSTNPFIATLHMSTNSVAPNKKAQKSRRHNSDDTELELEAPTSADPNNPWLMEWNMYLQTHETVPKGMGIVRWWGVCHKIYYLYNILLNLLAQCTLLSNVGQLGPRLSCNYGILSFKWVSILCGRNHH